MQVIFAPYAWLAYLASTAAWVYVYVRRHKLQMISSNLQMLPKTERLSALRLTHGPIPDTITAEEWIKERKNKLILVALLATLAVLAPIVLLALSSSPTHALQKFFGVPQEHQAKNQQVDGQQRAEEQNGGKPGDDQNRVGQQDGEKRGNEQGNGKLGDGQASGGESRGQDGGRSSSGQQEANEVANLGSGIDGVIEQVLYKVGEQVKAGKVVATISRSDLEAETQAAEAEVNSARNTYNRLQKGGKEQQNIADYEVQSAQASLDKAKLRYQRIHNLYNGQAVSLNDDEDASSNLKLAEAAHQIATERKKLANESFSAELMRAQADLEAANGRLEIAKARSARSKIIAPFTGTILKCMRKGEPVSVISAQPVIVMKKD